MDRLTNHGAAFKMGKKSESLRLNAYWTHWTGKQVAYQKKIACI